VGAVRRTHHVGFLVLASIVIGSMLLGLVSLNALLAQTSFRIDEAERRIEALAQEHLELVREQASLSAPGRIAAWARRNGMRLPDDIRSLHASGDATTAPAGVADTAGTLGGGA
jgi:cell division protein FtsL